MEYAMMPAWLTFAQQASFPVFALAVLLWGTVALIKAWPILRELQIKGDASMRSDLMGRVRELEERVKELEKLVSLKEANHAAREQFMRHQLANEEAALDAALAMLKISPESIDSIITEVTAMREAGRQRIALEKGAAAGAMVARAGGELPQGEEMS